MVNTFIISVKRTPQVCIVENILNSNDDDDDKTSPPKQYEMISEWQTVSNTFFFIRECMINRTLFALAILLVTVFTQNAANILGHLIGNYHHNKLVCVRSLFFDRYCQGENVIRIVGIPTMIFVIVFLLVCRSFCQQKKHTSVGNIIRKKDIKYACIFGSIFMQIIACITFSLVFDV